MKVGDVVQWRRRLPGGKEERAPVRVLAIGERYAAVEVEERGRLLARLARIEDLEEGS